MATLRLPPPVQLRETLLVIVLKKLTVLMLREQARRGGLQAPFR